MERIVEEYGNGLLSLLAAAFLLKFFWNNIQSGGLIYETVFWFVENICG